MCKKDISKDNQLLSPRASYVYNYSSQICVHCLAIPTEPADPELPRAGGHTEAVRHS